jgi:hypothetical protein
LALTLVVMLMTVRLVCHCTILSIRSVHKKPGEGVFIPAGSGEMKKKLMELTAKTARPHQGGVVFRQPPEYRAVREGTRRFWKTGVLQLRRMIWVA